jgi:hypothetical protein
MTGLLFRKRLPDIPQFLLDPTAGWGNSMPLFTIIPIPQFELSMI